MCSGNSEDVIVSVSVGVPEPDEGMGESKDNVLNCGEEVFLGSFQGQQLSSATYRQRAQIERCQNGRKRTALFSPAAASAAQTQSFFRTDQPAKALVSRCSTSFRRLGALDVVSCRDHAGPPCSTQINIFQLARALERSGSHRLIRLLAVFFSGPPFRR